MVMSSQYNNYDPFGGFNPSTALSDVRNQMMDAYGQMSQSRSGGMGGGMGGGMSDPFASIGGGMGGMNGPVGIGNTMMGAGPGAGGMANPFAGAGMPFQMPQMGGQMGGGMPPMGQSYDPSQYSGGWQPNWGGGMQAGGGMQQPQQGGMGGAALGGTGEGGIAGYGLPVGQGAPGGNGVNWLDSLGMPIPSFLRQVSNGQTVGPANYNNVLQGLGGVNGLMSPQTLNNLNPSELDFLQGFFETVLGVPFQDVIQAAQRPFAGLGGAAQGQTTWQ